MSMHALTDRSLFVMAGVGLFWEKSITSWLLVVGLFWEKSTVASANRARGSSDPVRPAEQAFAASDSTQPRLASLNLHQNPHQRRLRSHPVAFEASTIDQTTTDRSIDPAARTRAASKQRRYTRAQVGDDLLRAWPTWWEPAVWCRRPDIGQGPVSVRIPTLPAYGSCLFPARTCRPRPRGSDRSVRPS
jgi:hypothetical protein